MQTRRPATARSSAVQGIEDAVEGRPSTSASTRTDTPPARQGNVRPVPAKPKPASPHDYEYERMVTANLFMLLLHCRDGGMST